MNKTRNYSKHTTSSKLQRVLIDRFHDVVIQLLEPLKFDSLLDVGCGEGFTMNKINKAIEVNRMEGVDFSKEAISLGRKLFPKLNFKSGNIYGLKYEKGEFDLVTCLEVLEHLEQPDRAIDELRRVAKRYCLISVPHEPFFRLANLLRGKNVSALGNDPEHINHWSKKSFINFVESHGLKVKEVSLPFPWIVVLAEKS